MVSTRGLYVLLVMTCQPQQVYQYSRWFSLEAVYIFMNRFYEILHLASCWRSWKTVLSYLSVLGKGFHMWGVLGRRFQCILTLLKNSFHTYLDMCGKLLHKFNRSSDQQILASLVPRERNRSDLEVSSKWNRKSVWEELGITCDYVGGNFGSPRITLR